MSLYGLHCIIVSFVYYYDVHTVSTLIKFYIQNYIVLINSFHFYITKFIHSVTFKVPAKSSHARGSFSTCI